MNRQPASAPSACPNRERLADFQRGRLEALAAVEAVCEHVQGCGHCQAALDTLDLRGDSLIALLAPPVAPSSVGAGPARGRMLRWTAAGVVATGLAVGLRAGLVPPVPRTAVPTAPAPATPTEPSEANGRKATGTNLLPPDPIRLGSFLAGGKEPFARFENVPAGDLAVPAGTVLRIIAPQKLNPDSVDDDQQPVRAYTIKAAWPNAEEIKGGNIVAATARVRGRCLYKSASHIMFCVNCGGKVLLSAKQNIGEDWQVVAVAGPLSDGFSPGGVELAVRAGYRAQIVEVGDVSWVDYGPAPDLGSLPERVRAALR